MLGGNRCCVQLHEIDQVMPSLQLGLPNARDFVVSDDKIFDG